MPAALTSWVVTAAGILWPIGNVVGSVCAAASVFGVLLWRAGRRKPADAGDRHRLWSPLASSVRASGLRSRCAPTQSLTTPSPRHSAPAAEVAVTPSESALSVGHGRLMFRATLQQLGHDEISGRVVVFAPARDFSAVMVGQPMRFRARITRPTRHDLTVAVVNAIGAADDGSRRAGAPGCARGPRGVRRHRPSSAARRPGGDAARAGARRHCRRSPR